MEDFVTYEQALALKELGFKEGCLYHYDYNNQDLIPNNENDLNIWAGWDDIPASVNDFKISFNHYNENDKIYIDTPTLYQVQKWLRMSQKISVEPFIYWFNEGEDWGCNLFTIEENMKHLPPYEIKEKSYEEALSTGITECLKLLTKYNYGSNR